MSVVEMSDTEMDDTGGKTNLYWSLQQEPMISVEELKELLEAHPEQCREAEAEYRWLPLHLAIMNEASPELIRELLRVHPDGAKWRDKYGYNALHLALSSKRPLPVILDLLEAHAEGVKEQDEDGRLPLHLATIEGASVEVVAELLRLWPEAAQERTRDETLPLHLALSETSETSETAEAGVIEMLLYAHPDGVLEKDNKGEQLLHSVVNVQGLEKWMKDYITDNPDLVEIKDQQGTRLIEGAPKPYRTAMLMGLHFYGRYANIVMQHVSDSSMVLFARDLKRSSHVALKLMRNVEDFEREVGVRVGRDLSPKLVVPILRYHSGHQLVEAVEKWQLGSEYKYCVVMERAERTLASVCLHQNVAGKDWRAIRDITKKVGEALDHVHSAGLLHGDVKPLNIVRIGAGWKLIDLDASVALGNKLCPKSKLSSAYCPPELVLMSDDGTPALVPEEVDASVSFDIWGYGAMLYYLCTGQNLFHQTVYGSMLDLIELHRWSDAERDKRLELVGAHGAEVVSLLKGLLTTDPLRRPRSMKKVLEHPFFITTPPDAEGDAAALGDTAAGAAAVAVGNTAAAAAQGGAETVRTLAVAGGGGPIPHGGGGSSSSSIWNGNGNCTSLMDGDDAAEAVLARQREEALRRTVDLRSPLSRGVGSTAPSEQETVMVGDMDTSLSASGGAGAPGATVPTLFILQPASLRRGLSTEDGWGPGGEGEGGDGEYWNQMRSFARAEDAASICWVDDIDTNNVSEGNLKLKLRLKLVCQGCLVAQGPGFVLRRPREEVALLLPLLQRSLTRIGACADGGDGDGDGAGALALARCLLPLDSAIDAHSLLLPLDSTIRNAEELLASLQERERVEGGAMMVVDGVRSGATRRGSASSTVGGAIQAKKPEEEEEEEELLVAVERDFALLLALYDDKQDWGGLQRVVGDQDDDDAQQAGDYGAVSWMCNPCVERLRQRCSTEEATGGEEAAAGEKTGEAAARGGGEGGDEATTAAAAVAGEAARGGGAKDPERGSPRTSGASTEPTSPRLEEEKMELERQQAELTRAQQRQDADRQRLVEWEARLKQQEQQQGPQEQLVIQEGGVGKEPVGPGYEQQKAQGACCIIQ